MSPEPEVPEGLDPVRAQQLDCIAVSIVDLMQLEVLINIGRYICVQNITDALEATGYDELPDLEYRYLHEAVGFVAAEERDLYVLDDDDYYELLQIYRQFEKDKGLDGETIPTSPPE